MAKNKLKMIIRFVLLLEIAQHRLIFAYNGTTARSNVELLAEGLEGLAVPYSHANRMVIILRYHDTIWHASRAAERWRGALRKMRPARFEMSSHR